MAFTHADAAALRAAIAKGASSLELNGEKVSYRSLKEMRETLAMIEAELSATPAGLSRVSYPRTTRGL
ncbi:phage head-tail joining protein [Paracoccus tibetensis]|uniref:GpW protein n=1 Tax=Paracoccus tibetensis TaxID=336292 RepID=A0A1G5HDW8_9RHOB|nr:hypothetical protein [Paracoccus tibetensis]SCY61689.1 hypothetical protein SAMN05660710_02114 [Paracoccus tibetensis]